MKKKLLLSVKIVIIYPIIITFSAVLCDQILYKQLLVPRLPELQYVPTIWWFGVFSPILLCCLIIGATSKSYLEPLYIALPTAILYRIYGYIAAVTHQPGYHKSLAIEAPLKYWTIDLILAVLVFTILLGLGWVSGNVIKKIGVITQKRYGNKTGS